MIEIPKANEILVRMFTDDGIEGIGIATSYTPIEAAIKAFKRGSEKTRSPI